MREFIVNFLTQYPWPHHALSRLMYVLTRARFKPWKRWQINWFIRRYQVNMEEADEPNRDTYVNFNTFFTRALAPGARPIVADDDTIACPVDGHVSQAGNITAGRIFQAKKHNFDLVNLLGGDVQRAAPFQDGKFATLYLSPRDYHRIHMPLTGELKEMVFVPGRLFSVSPRTTRHIPGLFARNERVVTIFDTEHGPMALILVGAMFVASIETIWAGVVAPRDSKNVLVWNSTRHSEDNPPICIEKGAEMGRFNMGSTVIVLFPQQMAEWLPDIHAEQPVVMGQRLGQILPSADTGRAT